MKKYNKNRLWQLLNQWWFYPILWFSCIFILAFISDSRSQGDTLKEDLIFFSYTLPLGWFVLSEPLFNRVLSYDKGSIIFIIIYYLIYIIGFIYLPFIKKRWEKILIIFLLFWILSAFFGCSVVASGLHGGL